MAEYSFVFPTVVKVLEKVGSPVLQRFSLAWGVRDELQKLENTLSSVRAVLLDAEEQQASNHQLRDWLGKLKDALYDAEVVLDDLEIDALHRRMFRRSAFRKVRCFFSRSNQLAFRFKMGHKIKNVRESFDEIAADRNKFKLTEGRVDRMVMSREMHSFVPADEVIGRDQDIENVIKLLKHTSDDEKVSIIPIVGLGGLGKTTLARRVYNDSRIDDEKFDLKIWVCISENFDLKGVITKILKSLDIGEDCSNLEIEQLQTRLRNILDGKKYFLVLDDVWNEDRGKWIEVKNLLMGGATGSKIVVTTRSKLVASVMATSNCHYTLEGLPYEDCLSLFLKWAFMTRQDAEQHPNLVQIGGEIVQKCKGVPLAVRTLGNLLYGKTEEHDWIMVSDNDIWKLEQKEDDILPALKLSYDQFPSYLKQCFAYCSMFEKDEQLFSHELIYLWRAQGLIRFSEQNQDLEDIGRKYIEQLWSRGFFQEVVEFGGFLTFKMHDLVHDLALLVAKPDCCLINNSDVQSSSISRKVRHLSFPGDHIAGDDFQSSLLELKHLRTLIFRWVGPTNRSFMEICISKFKYLWTLDLSNSSFEALPSSIGNLKHLRVLDLSGNVKIKSLPECICKLVGLETLLLVGCVELEKLPSGLGKLVRLKELSITTKEKCLPEKEIGCLTSLQILVIDQCPNMEFLLSDDMMQRLSSLRTLGITNCGSLVSLPTRGLRYLPMLENLIIADCEMLDLTADDHLYHGEAAAVDEETIQFQGGLGSLRVLGIFEISKLEALPLWILHGANNLMENLKSLQQLHISDCPQLSSLPEGMHRLTSVNEIRISNCPELIERCQRGIGEDWEKISHVPNIYLDDIKI